MENLDLFSRLAKEKRAILLYGMGNGADKIIAELTKRGTAIAAVFASDGFVRGQLFHGQRVLSFSEVRQQFSPADCVILLSFGTSRPEVLEQICRIAAEYELLIPDMPVCGGPLFDAAFERENHSLISAARALLADEASRTLFDRILEFRLTGNAQLLLDAVSEKKPWDYLATLTHPIRSIADFGAYNGDTAREAMANFPSLTDIIAAEPDPRNFRKLQEWSATVEGCRIHCVPFAICGQNGSVTFDSSGNRNAGLCTGKSGKTTVLAATPDTLIGGRRVDYIKYDIEGVEREALACSAQTIEKYLPALRIALYHHSADIFEIPLQLARMTSRYRLYITRARSVPAWDIDLIALPIEKD